MKITQKNSGNTSVLNKRLILLLKSLRKSEFKDFSRFVHSPFFNRQVTVTKLFEIIRRYYPEFRNVNLNPESVYSRIFTSEKYNYAVMKNLESDLLALAEEYLAVVNYRRNPFSGFKNLLNETNDRMLDNSFEKNLREAQKLLDKVKQKGEMYYFDKYNIELVRGMFMSTRSEVRTVPVLMEITDNFLNYFFLRILKLWTYLLNEEFLYKDAGHSIKMFDEITAYLKEHLDKQIPAVRIYFNILMLTSTNDAEYYHELIRLKEKHDDSLEPAELEDVYVCLRNFCVKQVVSGDTGYYLKQYFDLSKEFISRTTGDSAYVRIYLFMNIVITGLRFKEFEWVESFITGFGRRLPPEYRVETLSLVQGMYHFAGGNYRGAIAELSKINFDDCHHKTRSRNLMLQVYYELNEYEPALSLVDSYKHFLSREKTLSDSYRSTNLNFIKYYYRLLKLKIGESRLTPYELENITNASSSFVNKEWVMEKISEFKVQTKKPAP